MKKAIKVLSLFLVLICFIVGCNKEQEKDVESDYLVEITFEEFQEKLNNKETFILEIVQTGCHNCTNFKPKFISVLEEYEIVAYSINLSNVSSDANNTFVDGYGVSGTPTVMFFKDGKETSTMKRISGDREKEAIISKLKANGYIK